MHHKTSKKLASIAAALAALASVATVHGQSADALIDKLVDKGILTVKEANQLREESDKSFTSAYSVKSGMPDWVTSLRLNGDLRTRYDAIYSPEETAGLAPGTFFRDRHRFRYRLRFGAVATIKDNFEVGFRLTTSDPTGIGTGDPISGNSTFQDNGSKKMIYVDQAYAKWTAINAPSVLAVATVGKMENPFVFSEMVFDADYTPEGAAINLNYNLTDTQVIKFNGGAFMLDELPTADDPYLLGAQVRFDSAWTPKIQTSFGAGLLSIINAKTGLATANVPDQNHGNRRAGTALANSFSTVVLDAGVTYNLDHFPFYNALFPIRIGAEYMENLAALNRKQGYGIGFTLGKSGKKGLWDISYKYKELQGDVWYEELVDSDFGGFYQVSAAPFSTGGAGYKAGVNLRGHVLRLQYSFFDSFTMGSTIYYADVIDTVGTAAVSNGFESGVTRLQVDAVWKF